MSATLVAWIKEIYNAYDAYKSFEKHSEAAKRAVKGQTPYPQSKEVQTELSKLDGLAKKLNDIASKGIGEPDKTLDWSDVAKMIKQLEGSDKDRDQAVKSFRLIQLSGAEFTDQGDELSATVKKIADSAGKRRDAAVAIRDDFEELVEKFPDPTGDVLKLQFFECYQAFEAASGALGNVASAADAAAKRIDKDVEAARKKNKDLAKAFEDAYKASEKARKKK
jgi:hypothetical protein